MNCSRCGGLGFGLEATDGNFYPDSLVDNPCKRCEGVGAEPVDERSIPGNCPTCGHKLADQ